MDRRTIRIKKSKPRNARPYDRPNQGILGRVASKVKGLLNPSWIFNVSQWMGTPEEEPGCSSDPQEESSEEEDTQQQPPVRGAKRLRLGLEDPTPSILSEGTQTWLESPSSGLFNPASTHLPSTVTQSSLIQNKESVIMNGDDHSENSEGSASTSGCSSLVSSHKDRSNCIAPPNLRLGQNQFANLNLRGALSRRDVISQNEELSANMSASNLSLFSGASRFSPAAKLQRRSPAVSHSNQPGFNVSAFVGPSKMNQQPDRKVASPFYQGNTSFGGASSTRRMPVSVAPYQVERPPRNQIKVRTKRSEDSLEGMSSAAKRILMTLEKMSSPVTDAKKIPNTNRSPVDLSLYLMPPKLRSNVVSTPTTTKGPPIANISAISKLTTLKSCGKRRLQNTSMESFSVPTETKEMFINNPVSEMLQQDLSPENTVKSGGGKMRSKLTQKHQPSARSVANEELECAPLPNVPLPISKLPTFNFESKPSTGTNEIKKDETGFVFSDPIVILQKSTSPLTSNWNAFEFSRPIELEVPASAPGGLFTNCEFTRNPSNSTSVNSTAPSTAASNTAPSTAANSTTPFTTAASGFGNITKSSTTWQCSECWVDNPVKESKCLACETPKKVAPAPSGFSNLAKNSSTWQCSECWIQNAAKESKCLACETPKKGASTLPPASTSTNTSGFSGKWTCDSCWVSNPPEKTKCLACETPNPSQGSQKKSSGLFRLSPELEDSEASNSKPTSETVSGTDTLGTSGFSQSTTELPDREKKPQDALNVTPNGAIKLSGGFSVSVSGWECDTCLVRNASDKLKCAACETIRPSKRNVSGLKDPENFKFNSPLQNSPMTFKFGSFLIPAETTTTTTTSTFSFGLPSTTVSSTTTNTANSSVEPKLVVSTESSESKPVSEFKFGTPNMPTIEVTKTSIPVVDLVDNDNSGEVKQTNVFGMALSKNSESNKSSTSNGSTAFKITPEVGIPNSTGASSFFTPPSSTTSNVIKSVEEPKSTSLTETTTSKIPVPAFKFGAPNTPAVEVTKPSIPVVDLIDNDVKPSNPFGNAMNKNSGENNTSSISTSSGFKITPAAGNSSFSLPVSTDSKWLSTFPAKAEDPAAKPQPTVNSKSVNFQFSQSKESPAGGFNFKTPTALVSSTFGGFSMPASNNNSKNLSSDGEKPSLELAEGSSDKKSDSSFIPGVSTSSISSPFSLPTSNNSMFKVGDNVDAAKTTESSWGKSAPTASTISSATSGFSFGNVVATSSLQFPTNVSQSVDVKPAASVAPFSAAPTSSTFSFGNTAVTTTTQSSGLSFFAATAATTTATTSNLFTFGASSNASQTAKTGGFPATSTPSAVFKFGAVAPVSTSNFVFGAVKPEPVNSTATNFAFGSGTAASATPLTFSGFQTNQPPTTPAFQFGRQPTNNTAAVPAFGASSGGFSFGPKSETPNQLAPATSQAPATGFGLASMQQQSMFSGAVAPAFGKTEKPAGFNFGVPAATSSPVFQFGNAEKKQATSSQFSFGTPQETTTAGQFQTPFNITTPSTFNFGTASTQGAPFQFVASTGDNVNQSAGPRKIRKALRRVRKE